MYLDPSEFGKTVLHKAISNDQPERNGRPLGDGQSI